LYSYNLVDEYMRWRDNDDFGSIESRTSATEGAIEVATVMQSLYTVPSLISSLISMTRLRPHPTHFQYGMVLRMYANAQRLYQCLHLLHLRFHMLRHLSLP
jgi:hypothetical protein